MELLNIWGVIPAALYNMSKHTPLFLYYTKLSVMLVDVVYDVLLR